MIYIPVNNFSNIWKELHIRALNFQGTDDFIYIDKISKNLSKVSRCNCFSHWKIWISQNPPDFKNYFEWTVKLHNSVNKKLKIREISMEEAYKLYN